MGVSYIIQWMVSDGKSVQQTVEELQNLVEKFGGKKTGLFSIEHESYFPYQSNEPNKVLHTLINSEYPATTFSWFEEGSSVVCDAMLTPFILKLGEHWQPRKGGRMDCKGQRYTISDFVIKIGTVTQSSSTKGIAIEVEYTPCLYLEECWNIITEFMNAIFDNQVPATPQAIPTLMNNSIYKPQHTARQYVSLFENTFKKSANVR